MTSSNEYINISNDELNILKSNGDYPLKLHDILYSPTNQYEIIEFLGRGSYGQVVKCIKKDNNEVVAVKILKNLTVFAHQGQVEVSILKLLNQVNADEFNVVRTYEFFEHKSHTCIVFEKLEHNLYDYMRQFKFAPVPLMYIRPILKQILVSLLKLKELGLIHCDIKPENIMFVNQNYYPYRIKLIDFGSARQAIRSIWTTYLQSRYYRAPEIILGLPFDESIDMWSLGCVIAELFLGWPLYPGNCEYDQIRYISETQDLPSEKMLNNAKKVHKFFCKDVKGTSSFWRLKTPVEYKMETGITSKETRKYIFKCLDSITDQNIPIDCDKKQLVAENADRKEFVDLLKKMLTVDQEQRITPLQALKHAFVTQVHLVGYDHLANANKSMMIMKVCERSCITSSTHQPCSAPQPSTSLVANFVPTTTGSSTVTINDQLVNQATGLSKKQNTQVIQCNKSNDGSDAHHFSQQPAPKILYPTFRYQPSSTKYVVTQQQQPQFKLPIMVQQNLITSITTPKQYAIPVSVVKTGQRMLVPHLVQTSRPTGSQQMNIVPLWSRPIQTHYMGKNGNHHCGTQQQDSTAKQPSIISNNSSSQLISINENYIHKIPEMNIRPTYVMQNLQNPTTIFQSNPHNSTQIQVHECQHPSLQSMQHIKCEQQSQKKRILMILPPNNNMVNPTTQPESMDYSTSYPCSTPLRNEMPTYQNTHNNSNYLLQYIDVKANPCNQEQKCAHATDTGQGVSQPIERTESMPPPTPYLRHRIWSITAPIHKYRQNQVSMSHPNYIYYHGTPRHQIPSVNRNHSGVGPNVEVQDLGSPHCQEYGNLRTLPTVHVIPESPQDSTPIKEQVSSNDEFTPR